MAHNNANIPILNRGPAAAAPPPHVFNALAEGIYGIAYDLTVKKIERNIPDGWDMWRATVYKRIVHALLMAGFVQGQYSVYQGIHDPVHVWHAMLDLRRIEPVGIIQSVTRRLQMFKIPARPLILNDDIKLGGLYAPLPEGPTPAELVPHGLHGVLRVPQIDPQWPRHPGELPDGVDWTPVTRNGWNWKF